MGINIKLFDTPNLDLSDQDVKYLFWVKFYSTCFPLSLTKSKDGIRLDIRYEETLKLKKPSGLYYNKNFMFRKNN